MVRAGLLGPDRSLLDLALDLAVPPLTVLSLAVIAGFCLSLLLVLIGAGPAWVLAPWTFGLVALPSYVLVGLKTGRSGLTARDLAAGGVRFVARKLPVYAAIARGHDVKRWNRTDRGPGGSAETDQRVDVLGIPIDAVALDQAVERIVAAIGAGRLYQVCTINLDFLMNGYSVRELGDIFRKTSLNIADGAPVVWLGRLLGRRLPERVAGADLVPRLAQVCAERGRSIFLLGGEDGAAGAAAVELVSRYPLLKIAGVLEPPRADVGDMPNAALVDEINGSGADVLLVAFGHPKQERWIDLNRADLTTSVAIGVGCSFDLLAGRQRRAPDWMHQLGLEWSFRLAQEPGRLLDRYLLDARWLLGTALPLVIAERIRPA